MGLGGAGPQGGILHAEIDLTEEHTLGSQATEAGNPGNLQEECQGNPGAAHEAQSATQGEAVPHTER
eukprot:11075104-Heterocapsa_arctica.AAC.1